MVEELDPTTIEDENLRQKVVDLMNVVDKQDGTIEELTAEVQRLRDEINRLKGEQGKPKITGNNPAPDLSSRKERRESKSHHKSSKQDQIKIDRQVPLQVDRSQLPEDAQFKGYVRRVGVYEIPA
jgi:chromosome segregation ATPase